MSRTPATFSGALAPLQPATSSIEAQSSAVPRRGIRKSFTEGGAKVLSQSSQWSAHCPRAKLHQIAQAIATAQGVWMDSLSLLAASRHPEIRRALG
jgi:hypothetical protein